MIRPELGIIDGRDPEANIFITNGKLGIWYKFFDFTGYELLRESLVISPKQANVL